jgi:uncharacterized protein (DUF2384 family)
MFNDIQLHIAIMDNFEDEVVAFRWLFTPIAELNHRTPMEVISSGGTDRIIGLLEATSPWK